jgi:hypothetical protein
LTPLLVRSAPSVLTSVSVENVHDLALVFALA